MHVSSSHGRQSRNLCLHFVLLYKIQQHQQQPKILLGFVIIYTKEMSRPHNMPRNLTLTEELEKLEQSITLTLQGVSPQYPSYHISNLIISRNRSQFQPSPQNCNHKYFTDC